MRDRGGRLEEGGRTPSRRRDDAEVPRPELPADADISELDREVRKELLTLPKGLADLVGSHLVVVGRVLDEDPQLALAHARFARSRAGRVAAVREAVGLAAYHAGEWSEALAELRAARRLGGGPGRLAVLADCERALGRPERALEIARSPEAAQLGTDEAVELQIVAAGARRDLGQFDAAVIALQGPDLEATGPEPWRARLRYAYADNLLAAGREQDAIRWFLAAAEVDAEDVTDAAQRAVELSERPEPR
jgi:tetratricopeptide (TPR) repeat protein